MTKIFLTGATGYIGGDILYALNKSHPEYEVTAMVRNEAKGKKITAEYPKVKIVYGDNDSDDVLQEETKKAEIIVHTSIAADDVPSAESITKALKSHPSEKPVYLIHTSGAGILTFEDVKAERHGEASERQFNDWEGVSELVSLPDYAVHRDVDKIVLAAAESNPNKIKTAIVAPPCIYGPGRGPDKTNSVQIPALAVATLKHGKGVQVGRGKTLWGSVHIHDQTDMYVKLIESAAAGENGKATWGNEGYYLCNNGDIVWGHIARLVAESAHKQGFTKTAEVDAMSADEAKKLDPFAHYLWASNSRPVSLRAAKLLGWKATEKMTVEEAIDGTVLHEAKLMGLAK
ncbi:hypothetical protein AAFC00_003979 [Neodothiora populina]|uniref:NAD-dependent epimerase/dehydratase domain-containing protein n=1 Tax=Neodothiora populina TaxID=2781224 RepID=A0ABR3PI39_9PEZI